MGYTKPFLRTTLLLLLLFAILRPSLVAAVGVNAVVAPVYLDKAKYLYTVSLGSGQSYLLDIGGHSVWSVCPKSYITFPCKSYQCSLASASTNSSSYVSCHSHTCTTQSQNPMTGKRARSELTYTRAMLKATDGLKPGAPITFPKVLSSCAPHNLLKGLPANSVGSMGLGPSNLALQSQLAGLTKRFAFCVPLNDSKPGMIFFGNGPYNILSPGLVEATQYQTTAPMVRDPTRPDDYFLPVKEMEISGYDVGKVSTTTVKGRTKISTLVPYTTLSTPLYRALVKAFDNVTRHIPRAPLVAPFQRCLDISAFPRGKYGPPSLWDFLYIGPTFFLKMKGGDDWEFLNAENMKQVSKDVLCLAYLDGGVHPQDDIVIGLYQMKERLVLFDLEANKIGISSTNINYIHRYCGDFLAPV